MDTLRRVLGWVKPYRKRVALGFALMLVGMVLRMILPYITAVVVGEVLPGRDMELLIRLCGALIGITMVRAVIMYTRGMLFERVSQSVVYDLRTGLYAHMQEMSYSFFDKHHVGEIMSRMTGDIEGVRMLVINGCMGMTESLLMFVLSLISMSLMSWQLTLVMLVLCPVIAMIALKFNRVIRPVHAAIREQNAVLNTRTQENIAGVRVVKAFAQEEQEMHSFARENGKVLGLNLEATRIWSTYYPLLDMIASMATPLLLLCGGVLTLTGRMNIGTLVGVTGYVWMLTMPMRQVASYVNLTTNGLVSAEKLIYYTDLGSLVRDPKEPRTPEQRQGRVDFEGVSFRYDRELVLQDIDAHAEPGETIAVMGATGSGKSSLVSLIGRYYDVQRGAVLVDGIDVREQGLHELRRSIGVVMQETFLFSETIAGNIAFGDPDASMEDIVRAAKAAEADEFIRAMPMGYDTIVGERGLGLSGGQKQRVALARAILYDPKVLILDDSTSAVDMETEAEIQQHLKAVMKGRTTFVIAHRISSVRAADQIWVLEAGRIAERGTHEELLALNGLYTQMYADQTQDLIFDVDDEPEGGA